MKKLRILVVDDTQENINAAKIASKNFPQHEFVFITSAEKAFGQIEDFDAVVTDLFFKEDPNGELKIAYDAYTSEVDDSKRINELRARAGSYVDIRGLEETVDLLKNGIPAMAIRNTLTLSGRFTEEKISDEISKLQKEFPLGGALMIRAKELGKSHCLVTSIHRHAGSFSDAATSIHGVILLIPLMDKNIATVEQIVYDGQDCLTYMGSDQIEKFDVKIEGSWKRTGKTDLGVWSEAIRRVLAQ